MYRKKYKKDILERIFPVYFTAIFLVVIGIFLAAIGTMTAGVYFNYKMYDECTKTHSKFYCMHTLTDNHRVSVTEIKDK